MTDEKLFKAIRTEVSEASRAHKDKKKSIMKACLLHIKTMIKEHLNG